jgi:cathepsin H
VTPVKDQGDCGSCWTFSTVGTLESHWNILAKGKNVLFSEQQLVDCADDFENYGCDGGLPSQAFEYIHYAGGIETSSTYPYTAKDGRCVFRPQMAAGYVKYGSYNVTEGDEDELAERLYSVGPMAVSFEVLDSFQFYKSGVYSAPDCGTTTQDVNHAVVATGYGTENGKKFWNIKNSWSTSWGVNGYFKLERGTNMCAISQCNSYPLIDSMGMIGVE